MAHTSPSSGAPLKMGIAIPNGKLGMWLFLGTEIMFFTAFIGAYLVSRFGSPSWPTDPAVTHILVPMGAINTFVLILSSYFVVLAHEAMNQHDYKKTTWWMTWTLVLSCVFLGIKSVEYYGKIDHKILPGIIPESDQDALETFLIRLDAANGALATETELNSLKILRTKSSESEAQVLSDRIDSLERKFTELSTLRGEYQAFANKVSANRGNTIQGAEDAAKLVHEGEELLHELHENHHDVYGHIHFPYPIKWGNLFASFYFLMTGFHAIHVIVGMILFAYIIQRGLSGKLGPGDGTFVENCGLYWHFVDLVWIFLFPLVYIV